MVGYCSDICLPETGQQISGDTENKKAILADNDYNELGQLMLKKLHSANNNSFIQDTDYLYDIRGWLTNINKFDDAGRNKLYSQALTYSKNGNIDKSEWKNTLFDGDELVPTNRMAYGFTYDWLNRLDKADYSEIDFATGKQTNKGNFDVDPGYDLNGNITNLSRWGNKNDGTVRTAFGLIDNLKYNYPKVPGSPQISSNQLVSVSDGIRTGVNHDLQYKPIRGSYSYDANGNATRVQGKGTISYNYLDLPEHIVASQGTITYLYDASGNKLRKSYNGADSYYQGSVLKIDGKPVVLTGEGRVVFANDMWNYEYDLKDHLGNTRVSFRDQESEDVIGAEPLQYKDYYPFGMEMAKWYDIEGSPTKYLYNGKELQDEGGLDWYDFGKRFYDPALARFHTVDPLAERFSHQSLYVYADNNPIRFIDYMGMNADGYQSLDGDLEWFDEEHDDMIYKNDQFYFKVSEDKEVFEVAEALQDAGVETTSEPESGTISEYEPNVAGDLKDKLDSPSNSVAEKGLKMAGKLAYKIADEAFVTGTTFINGRTNARHLDNSGATPSEVLDAGMNSISGLVPVGKFGQMLGVGKKSVNAAQFSSMFKGQGVLQQSHKLRGSSIKIYNSAASSNSGFTFQLFGIKAIINTTNNQNKRNR